jgi:hypothetical protein
MNEAMGVRRVLVVLGHVPGPEGFSFVVVLEPPDRGELVRLLSEQRLMAWAIAEVRRRGGREYLFAEVDGVYLRGVGEVPAG